FLATLGLADEIGFAQGFCFKYSRRPGTPAASATGQVPEQVKSDRLDLLQRLVKRQQLHFNEACIGRVLPLRLEKPGPHDGQLVGRSPYFQSVHVSAPLTRLGATVTVMISGASANSLSGSLAQGAVA